MIFEPENPKKKKKKARFFFFPLGLRFFFLYSRAKIVPTISAMALLKRELSPF
jgi:hypothetical protein